MIQHQQIVQQVQKKSRCERRCAALSFVCWPCSFLLLLLLLVFAACGGDAGQGGNVGNSQNGNGQTTKGGTTLFDPCMLLSSKDAAQALGAQVSIGADLSSPVCHYSVSASSANKPVAEKGILVSAGRSDDAAGYFGFVQTVDKGTTSLQHVTDIGNDAFFLALPIGGSLEVRQGGVIYNITLLNAGMKTPAVQDTLKKLAVIVGHALATGAPSLAVSTPHPCQLVTSHEASQQLQGKPVHWLLTANTAGVTSCDYVSSLGVRDQLLVMMHEKQSGTKAIYEKNIKMLTKKKPLAGMGDEAFFDGVNTSVVWKQNAFFYVSVLGLKNPEQVSERLARLASQRFSPK